MSQFQTKLNEFLRTVRARSDENAEALALLLDAGKLGVAVGLLRQEIDTFVRLVYLCAIAPSEAQRLISDFGTGERWRRQAGTGRITDREMVDVATQQYFWVDVAYRFGCRLIHLSQLHDYATVDPFTRIPVADTSEIVSYLGSFHGYPDHDIDMSRFIDLLPAVMNKIRGKVTDCSSTLTQQFAT